MTTIDLYNPHAACYALERVIAEWDQETNCPADRTDPEPDDDLRSLTIVDHPHITARGSIVANRLGKCEESARKVLRTFLGSRTKIRARGFAPGRYAPSTRNTQ